MKEVLIAILRFSGSLATMANVSNFTACISLNNQLCVSRSTFINFNSDEYN